MDSAFFDHLAKLDCSQLRILSQLEGNIVFPRVPLIRVEGPLLVAQLLETPLLALVNYASLVATNAARHRIMAGECATLLEFGLRRAQGTDGGEEAQKLELIHLTPLYPVSDEISSVSLIHDTQVCLRQGMHFLVVLMEHQTSRPAVSLEFLARVPMRIHTYSLSWTSGTLSTHACKRAMGAGAQILLPW